MSNALPHLSFQARAYQDFVRSLRGVWRAEAYQGTLADAERTGLTEPAALESALATSPAYQLYGWLERRSQQFKYLGRWGMIAWLETQGPELEAMLADAARLQPERLRLDPDFVVPDYVRDTDTHQHPGATWGNDVSAFVYEWATQGVSFAQTDSDLPATWYAGLLAKTFAPTAMLDIGCSVGKSSRALKRANPDATLDAVDVGAPMLKLAHLRSVEAGLPITYWQMNAEALGFEAGRFDLVSSHWMFHEMPPAAIRQSLREMRRVLKPGGGLSIYDMNLTPGGPLAEWLHMGYAARNNEPFAAAFARMNMEAELRAAGFEDIEVKLAEVPSADLGSDGDSLPPTRVHLYTVITGRAGEVRRAG